MLSIYKLHLQLGLTYCRASRGLKLIKRKRICQPMNYAFCTSDLEPPVEEPVSDSSHLSLHENQPVSQNEIKSFLHDQSIVYTEGYTSYKTTCPRHSVSTLDIGEVDKLFINIKTGFFVCQSCQRVAPWHVFKDITQTMVQLAQDKTTLPESCFDLPMSLSSKQKSEVKQAETLYSSCVSPENLEPEEVLQLLHTLGLQKLEVSTLQKFNVRVLPAHNGLVIPLYGISGQMAGIKVIYCSVFYVKQQERRRVLTKTVPRLDIRSLFGSHLIKRRDKNVILTGNELDAMAIHQETGLTVLALPRGQNILHQELLPGLEQFSKITVWLDGDIQTWETAIGFTRKLNDKRCYLIRPSADKPNALKALQQNTPMDRILHTERAVSHKSIVSFQNLRQDVYLELSDAEKRAGVQWERFPIMNKLLKGHRRGELTIFTGPTGAGKTTFISEYSLDLCMKGVNTLWGSFEINNIRLLKTMLTQFAQCNLVTHIDQYDSWADKFELLPMYFMTFHGQENIKRVIETMSHAAYVYDISHVIVDNLQFMMGSESPRADERFYRQDQLIAAFRKFATTMNCHVTLVVHPRKERENELTVSSIFGSAKASQEADNVLILQDKRLTSIKGRKYVQVAKNRFDGELGVMLLKFNKDSKSYSVTPVKKDSSEMES